MTSEKFKRFFRTIFAVREKEILCSEFFDTLPRYADLKLEGKDAEHLFPTVSHHLQQCPECEEVYHALLEALESEKEPRGT